MKKYLLGLALLCFTLIGCEESTSTSGPIDNATNNYPESVDIMKQVDSLFNAENILPPDNWNIKQVIYTSEYSDESMWNDKKLHDIIYFSEKDDYLMDDFPELSPISRPKINYLNTMSALLLAVHSFESDAGSNNIILNNSYHTLEYNSDNKPTQMYFNDYKTGAKIPMMKFYYENNKLVRIDEYHGSWIATDTYSYGENGLVNRLIHSSSDGKYIPDTTHYEYNSDGYITFERSTKYSPDNKTRNNKKEYLYSTNKIIVNHYLSDESSEPDDVKTYTYQDNQYQKILSHEYFSGSNTYGTIFDYGEGKIVERENSDGILSTVMEFILDSQGRISEEIFFVGNGVPAFKNTYEYYSK